MSKAFHDVLMTVGVRVALVAAGLATTITTARWLGPAGRGDYFFVIAFSAIAGQIVHLGLHASNAYYVARDPSQFGPLAVNSYWISVVLGFFSAAVGLIVINFVVPLTHQMNALWWALLLTPTSLATLLIGNLYVGAGRIAEYNLIQLTSALLPFLLICGVSLFWRTAPAFLGAAAIASVLNQVLLGAHSLRGSAVPLGFDTGRFRTGFRFALKAYVVNALSTVSIKSPALIFPAGASSVELGYFSVASQVFDAVCMIPASVAAVAFPRLMKLGASRWRETCRYMFVFMAIASILAFCLGFFASQFIQLLFGTKFLGAVRPMQFALPAAVFVSGTSILSQYLATHGMPGSASVAWLVAASISLGAGPFLIERFGATGASMTLTAATLVAWLLLLVLSLRQPRAALV